MQMITTVICVLIYFPMIPYFYVLHQNLNTGVSQTLIRIVCLETTCIYVTEDDVSFLLDWCDPNFSPKIKYYVYKITYSSVMRKKCKLVR
jgi:hypothetical protein